MWLLHGHVHEKWRQQGRMVNVGVDVWDFTPIAEDVITGRMDATPGASSCIPGPRDDPERGVGVVGVTTFS